MHTGSLYAAVASFLLLCLLAPAGGGEPGPEPQVQGAARRLWGTDRVSEPFRARCWAAADSIPDHVWRGVQRSGWRVELARFVVDAAPDLSDRQPRGWPAGSYWQNTDAVHLPQDRLLILAEKRRGKNGRIVDNLRVAGVLRHELGHAFDMATGGPYRFHSSRPEFARAYRQDVGRLRAEPPRRRLSYYLQDGPAGRQETFAEAFGIALGGGSDEPNRSAFQTQFPEVLEYLHRAIADYRPD